MHYTTARTRSDALTALHTHTHHTHATSWHADTHTSPHSHFARTDCGWCGNKCVNGNNAGPTYSTICEIGTTYYYNSTQCCAIAANCTECTSNSLCGWCTSEHKCKPGNAAGPTGSTCFGWAFNSMYYSTHLLLFSPLFPFSSSLSLPSLSLSSLSLSTPLCRTPLPHTHITIIQSATMGRILISVVWFHPRRLFK